MIYYSYYSFTTPTTHLLLLLLIYYSYYSFTTPTTHLLLLLLIYYSDYSLTTPTACGDNLLRRDSTRSRSDLRFRAGVEHTLYNTGAEFEAIPRASSGRVGPGSVWFRFVSFGLVWVVGHEASRVRTKEEEKGGGFKPN